MTPDDLSAWRTHMGYTQRAAAKALGMTLAGYQRLERGADWTTGKSVEIDRRTALACGAIAAGVHQWGPECGSQTGNRTPVRKPETGTDGH